MKKLIVLIMMFGSVYSQYPSASFEYDEYLIDENLDRASVTLQIENPYLMDLGGINIDLYANPSVIQFDLQSVSMNIDAPFEYDTLLVNIDNDTLKLVAVTSQSPEIFSVPFTKLFDISFDIIGEVNESTLIEFTKFQLQDDYTENTISTNIILVDEEQCLGDMNGDTILDILDIKLMVNMIFDGEYDVIADINEDDELNILDIVTLMNDILDGDDVCETESSICDGLTEVELWGEWYDIESTYSIDLNFHGLTGSIPPEIGCLTNLTTLYLMYTELTGEIPSEIGNLTNLTGLILNNNQLTGQIPPEIGNLMNLTGLVLHQNQLEGEIPQEVCDLIESNSLNIAGILIGNNLIINTCE